MVVVLVTDVVSVGLHATEFRSFLSVGRRARGGATFVLGRDVAAEATNHSRRRAIQSPPPPSRPISAAPHIDAALPNVVIASGTKAKTKTKPDK